MKTPYFIQTRKFCCIGAQAYIVGIGVTELIILI